MSREKIKGSVVIFIFSLIIMLVFIFISIYLQKSMKEMNVFDYMSQEEFEQYELTTDEQSQGIQISDDEEIIRYHDIERFKDYSHQEFISILIPVSIGFCIFVILSSTGLCYILKQIKRKEDQRIIQELKSIQGNNQLPIESGELQEAYYYIQQKYEAHMADFKRLNAYLSHDQRNTLMLLRNNIDQGRIEDAHRNIQILSQGIDDILTLSDHEENNNLVLVDIIMECADIIDLYQNTYSQLTFEFIENEILYIYAKPRWIRQAVSNLIDNAIKYGNNKEIILTVSEKRGCIIIEVKDHGIGIDQKLQEHIFQHCYRVNELNKNGYGIGLSVVAHVCQLCQGFIYCDSQPNMGTTFYLSFQKVVQ